MPEPTELTISVVAIPEEAVEIAGYRYVTHLIFGEQPGFILTLGQRDVFNLLRRAQISINWTEVDAGLSQNKAWRGSVPANRFQVETLLQAARYLPNPAN